MNGNCHFVFGAAAGAVAAVNMPILCRFLPNIQPSDEMATLFVLGGILGGLFPDIDNPKSYMGRLSIPMSRWIGKAGKITGKTAGHHRGILHDAAIYPVLLVLSYLYFPSMLGFVVGCISHLYLDMFNPNGIPFFFGAHQIHMGKIKSGSRGSIVLTWVNVAFVLFLGFSFHYSYI